MTYVEKLGCKPARKLNKKLCAERVRIISKAIAKKDLRGKDLERARYYVSHYKWLATTL